MSAPTKPTEVDNNDGWIVEWWCEPPSDGALYVAVRDEWSDDYRTRRIYEWKAAE